MKIICRVPARIGLGGGGTDISDYFNIHGGAVLNCTINQYVYCTISSKSSGIYCESVDKNIVENRKTKAKKLILHWAAIKYFKESYNLKLHNIRLTTYTDIPEGSGLGTSSSIVVSIVKCISEYANLSLDKSEIVNAAFNIERVICGLRGGFQDYISATFGGINFTEFFNQNEYLVHPLKISKINKSIFESQATLIFSGLSRSSSKIISDQQKSVDNKSKLLHMHKVRDSSYSLKKALITSDFDEFQKIFRESWDAKKSTSKSVTNKKIKEIEKDLYANGASAIKVSGAGGGGFIIALSNSENILNLRKHVQKKYKYRNFSIVEKGAQIWKIK